MFVTKHWVRPLIAFWFWHIFFKVNQPIQEVTIKTNIGSPYEKKWQQF